MMRASVFAKWVRAHKFVAYVGLPAGVGVVMILLYFSGIGFLQNVVAPAFYGVDMVSSTKVGALELLQLVLLLGVVFFTVRCLMMCTSTAARILYLLILGGVLFVLYQETDLGSHYSEYLNRPPPPVRQANYGPFEQRPPPPEAEIVASQFNLIANGAVLGLMLVLPLLQGGHNRTLRLLIPSGWLSLGVLTVGSVFYLAWHLNERGFGMIDSAHGALRYDIGEFLALGMYWLLLLTMSAQHERNVARQ